MERSRLDNVQRGEAALDQYDKISELILHVITDVSAKEMASRIILLLVHNDREMS